MPEITGREEANSKLAALSEMHRRFVVALVVGKLCATDAARAAGYVDNGNGAIRVRAHHLLRRSDICDAIDGLAWQKFREQYVPVHKRTRSASYLAGIEKVKTKSMKARAALRALQDLGIEV